MRIGVIGVGLLGRAVASRLLEHGFDVTGYDTRPDQLEALVGHGLHAAQGLSDVTARAEAIFTILPTLESVETVVCGPGGLTETARPDTVILQMSTISPDLTKRLYQQVSAHDLHFLDTPISGTSAMVARGDCTIFVGGDPVQKQRCDPLFEAISRRAVHIGDIGTASLAKLVTNMLVALNTVSLAEALVLAAKGGIDPAQMMAALMDSAAASRMMEIRGPLMVTGDFPPQMKLNLFLKDIQLMIESGEQLEVALPLTQAAQQLYASAANMNSQAGERDLSVVIQALERLSGMR
ncbi:MAG: hypothetical protein ETSY1_10410 [Candidatus Entotheonella factor]|uniref:2-hydroxy-3-oxopropionate reductase n=1 Tax=Entotheonella factor TaxID=1429438 RepID=W4LRQ6_ENTF1|nr:MAG: hypothetical protein ETSY1_10410 [Candidatus Entotheonella factor]